MERVKFDGKHWIGKRTPKGPLQIHSYDHVANQVLDALGKGGIVAIPNARPDEYRFEEFCRLYTNYHSPQGIFYDFERGIHFVKAQEINTKLKGIPITFLVYNLPFGKNIDDKDGKTVLDKAQDYDCIIGITGPSCINNLENVFSRFPQLPGYLDFFAGWSGGAKSKKHNDKSLEFYLEHLQGKTFVNDRTGEAHRVGLLAVSGGHRCPRGLGKLISKPTIGTSYTKMPGIEATSEEQSLQKLRENSRNSQEVYSLHIEMNLKETYFKHALSLFIFDKIRKAFGRY